MSYQFDDDSALEELLNKQLDRKKQEPSVRISQRASTATKELQQQQRDVQHQANDESGSLRSSSLFLGNQVNDESTDYNAKSMLSLGPSLNKSQPMSKMAAWLSDKNTAKADSTEDMDSRKLESMQNEPKKVTNHSKIMSQKEQVNRLLNESFQESRLQEMSKQRLIQIIVQQVCPNFRDLLKMLDEQSVSETDKLREELNSEKNKVYSLKIKLAQEIDLAQNRWLQLKKQTDLHTELTERELNETITKQRVVIDKLEKDYKEQLSKISESYKDKLKEEKQSFEETLKRREEFHKLELDSKLKVNFNLNTLEATFKQWQTMIQTSVDGFDGQFRTIENLLEKQTVEINGTNSELLRKTKQLFESYQNFDRQNKQFEILTKEMGEIMPSFISFQRENELICKKTSDQLSQFLQHSDKLKEKELELEKMTREILLSKENLNRDKYQLDLDNCKLAYKEERLNELLRRNEEIECKLEEQKRKLIEQEARLDTLQRDLESKTKQIKEQNYELHLSRKDFTQKQEDLIKTQVEISNKRKLISEQLTEIRSESNKLTNIRGKAQKELSQLKRLQKSLICSICLDRLFHTDKETQNFDKSLDHSIGDNDWQANVAVLKLLSNKASEQQTMAAKGGKAKAVVLRQASNPFRVTESSSEFDISKINQQLELDARQLEMENKYIELLKTS